MRKDKSSKIEPRGDVCNTPKYALSCLMPYVPTEWLIWESSANSSGYLERAIRAYDRQVIATGLPDHDYFCYEPQYYDIQVTNPPYSIKYKWIERAFYLGKPFALLVPYETTFAKAFYTQFKRYHGRDGKYVAVLSPHRRINFHTPTFGWGEYTTVDGKRKKRGGSAQMPTCWVTWGLPTLPQVEPLPTYYVDLTSDEVE